ncbi:transcriptional regulator [Streptomyces sp. SCUT-3]|nr:transcriptional regulator [Streptomyces sp. DJ]QMV21229.1 transcriptional regulator [Streptomyces sp. SCUT-3]
MQFNLIGPFEIVNDNGGRISPGMPKVRQTLSVLLTRPGEIASTDSLIQELWGDEPPRSATTTLQTYVYHARKLLEEEGAVGAGRSLLVTQSQGYMADVSGHRVDVTEFERLVTKSQSALNRGDAEQAGELLQQAFVLWRGPALSDVPTGRVLKGRIVRLEELRIRALELRIETGRRLGRYRESIPELRELVATYPFNEWFHGQLIDALHRSGRRAEALQAYQGLRRILSEELGLEPSSVLQRLQLEVLAASPSEPSVGTFDWDLYTTA